MAGMQKNKWRRWLPILALMVPLAGFAAGEVWQRNGIAVGTLVNNLPAETGSVIMSEVVQVSPNLFRMYYAGRPLSQDHMDIWLAESADGTNWQVRSKVLSGIGDASGPEYTLNAPSILQLPDGRWRLYYNGSSAFDDITVTPRFQMFCAISTDGISFTREGVCIPGKVFTPEAIMTSTAHGRIRTLDNGGYVAVVGGSTGGQQGIYTLVSNDGLNFTSPHLILPGGHDPVVVRYHGQYLMYADPSVNSGVGSTATAGVMGTSPDGINWTISPDPVKFTDTDGTQLLFGGGSGNGLAPAVGDLGAVVLANGNLRIYSNFEVRNIAYFERAAGDGSLPIAAPTCSLEAIPPTIFPGGSATLRSTCDLTPSTYNWSANSGLAANAGSGTVTPSVTTIYTLTGVNAKGTGNTASVTVSVGAPSPTRNLQSIAFTNPGNWSLSQGLISLNASASSALPVTAVSQTPAVCSTLGSTVSLLGVGTCSVAVSQPGDANYSAAPAVTQSFNIYATPAALPLARRGGIDLDGAGRAAIVARSADGHMQALRLVGNSLQASALPDPGTSFRLIGAVDFNGNGKSDLAYQNTTQGEFGDVRIWPDFQQGSDFLLRNVKLPWLVQAVGDLDGDGFGDMVFRFTGDDGVPNDTGVSYIWFTNGTSVQQVRKRGGAPLSWRLLGAVDINGDGAADMIYISPAGAVRALMATPSRTCANLAAGTVPSGFDALKLADFTGGRSGDILLRNPLNGDIQIMSLNATGITLPPPSGDPDIPNASCNPSVNVVNNFTRHIATVDTTWALYAAGDLNGDGIADIVWQRPGGQLTVWLMNAGGPAPIVIDNAGTASSGYSVLQP